MDADKQALDLAAIEARANAATEGPWEDNGSSIDRHWSVGGQPVIELLSHNRGYESHETLEWKEADRAFIAHARSDVPALVARVRELEAQLADALKREDETQTWFDEHPCSWCRP